MKQSKLTTYIANNIDYNTLEFIAENGFYNSYGTFHYQIEDKLLNFNFTDVFKKHEKEIIEYLRVNEEMNIMEFFKSTPERDAIKVVGLLARDALEMKKNNLIGG